MKSEAKQVLDIIKKAPISEISPQALPEGGVCGRGIFLWGGFFPLLFLLLGWFFLCVCACARVCVCARARTSMFWGGGSTEKEKRETVFIACKLIPRIGKNYLSL